MKNSLYIQILNDAGLFIVSILMNLVMWYLLLFLNLFPYSTPSCPLIGLFLINWHLLCKYRSSC